MVEYFTEAYWEELASTLNNDEEFQEEASDLSTEFLFVADDEDRAFRLSFDNGKVTAESTAADADAEFTFRGPYDQWVENHKGEADLQRLIMMGKIQFEGAMSRIMSLRSQLGDVTEVARSIEAEY